VKKREGLFELPPIWEKRRTYICCDRNRCIKKVGLSKISATRKKISRYSDNERKEFLLSLLIHNTATGKKFFVYDKVRVCNAFLRAAFLYTYSGYSPTLLDRWSIPARHEGNPSTFRRETGLIRAGV